MTTASHLVSAAVLFGLPMCTWAHVVSSANILLRARVPRATVIGNQGFDKDIAECIVEAKKMSGSLHALMEEEACVTYVGRGEEGLFLPMIDISPAKEAIDERLADGYGFHATSPATVEERRAKGLLARILSWHMFNAATLFSSLADKVRLVHFSALEMKKVKVPRDDDDHPWVIATVAATAAVRRVF